MDNVYAYSSEFANHDVVLATDRGEITSLTPSQARELAQELLERADYADGIER